MSFHPKNLKSEKKIFEPRFNILHTVDSQCLEYFGYITLTNPGSNFSSFLFYSILILPPKTKEKSCETTD